jgi:TonB family protein
MPFSFFNVVFIDIQEYSERELSNIIAHEKVHIQERHWIDLLIIELLAVLFWINPVVWLYERSIKQNHEYLADQGVLLAGYSPGQYQALLINQLMGVKVLGFAHNLNFSLNKKRMEMMKKEKSPWASKMKLLLALPIIALLVFAFAKKEYVTHEYVFDTQSDQEPIEVKIKLHKATFNITLPEIGDDEELIRGAIVEVPSPEFDDREESRQGEIVELPPPPKGNKKKEIFTIVEEMPNYKNGGMYQLAADIKELTTSISKNTSDRGEVLVGFTVAADGSIVNPQVVESSKSKMLDGSAIKIIQKLDNWSPGIQRGKKVPVDLTVPVKFE